MNILYGRCFGLGNAICALPAIKALQNAGHDVDILVGFGPDDGGAYDVMRLVGKRNITFDHAVNHYEYDVAVMAMPFDGRWKNGASFKSKSVIDCLSRPDPSTFGFSSWKKHEVEYQMENVYRILETVVDVPDCSFMERPNVIKNSVYLGMGYKKDQAGFWAQKQWGNENFARLIDMIVGYDPKIQIITTGDELDMKMTIWPVQKMLKKRDRLIVCQGGSGIRAAFQYVGACETFVGNDTGMTHVAASFDLGVVPYYKMENAWVKSRPWCKRYELVKGHDHDVTPEEMYSAFRKVHYGEAR